MINFKKNVLNENDKITDGLDAFRVVNFDKGMLTFSRRDDLVILGVIYVEEDDAYISEDIISEILSQFCDIMKEYKIITHPTININILLENGFEDITKSGGATLYMYNK